MPEFKISVLVYAESAEDRFILMNGERLLEGDEVEGGVVLEEIRRDGAIFSFRSQRFLVKS
jgi:general secretion pathway protein B